MALHHAAAAGRSSTPFAQPHKQLHLWRRGAEPPSHAMLDVPQRRLGGETSPPRGFMGAWRVDQIVCVSGWGRPGHSAHALGWV